MRGGDPGGDVLGVEIHRHGVDVGEDGRRSAPRDRFRSRIERERRTDHFVARSDPERIHDEHEASVPLATPTDSFTPR